MLRVTLSSLILMAAAVAGPAQEYAIKLSRPLASGDRFIVEASVTTRLRTLAKSGAYGEPPRHTEYTFASIRARGRVDSIGTGRPTGVTLTVEVATSQDADRSIRNFLPEGAVIEFRADAAGERYALRGGELDEATLRLLEDLLPLKKSRDLLRDDLTGTSAPRSIGDKWGLKENETGSDLFELTQFGVERDDIEGVVTLLGTETLGDDPCLKIRGQLNVTGFKKLKRFPEYSTRKSRATIDVIGHYPTDLTRPMRREEATIIGAFDLESLDPEAEWQRLSVDYYQRLQLKLRKLTGPEPERRLSDLEAGIRSPATPPRPRSRTPRSDGD